MDKLWVWLVLGSSLCQTLTHIIRKRLLHEAEVVDEIILMRISSMLFTIPIALFVVISVPVSILFLVFLNSALVMVGVWALDTCYKHAEISSVSPLLNFNPLLVFGISFVILGEILTLPQFGGVILVLFGGYLITLKDIRTWRRPFTSLTRKQYLLMSVTLVLWAFSPPLIKIIQQSISPYQNMLWTSILSTAAILAISFAYKRTMKVIALMRRRWGYTIGLGILSTLQQLLFFVAIGMPGVLVSLVMPIRRSSSLYAVILGGNLFKEKNLMLKTIASLIMIAGLFIIAWYS